MPQNQKIGQKFAPKPKKSSNFALIKILNFAQGTALGLQCGVRHTRLPRWLEQNWTNWRRQFETIFENFGEIFE